jgi:carbamoyl-phosphate synthase large subunit
VHEKTPNNFQAERLTRLVFQPFLGQLPQNIALRLKNSGVNVLGTAPEQIDNAEDRHKFSSILDSIGVDQPDWTEAASLQDAKAFASRVG